MLMATYKVIQDIEAEDKLIWQLSFRQFVYALIAAVFLYISYLFIAKHILFMDVLTLPIALFTGFLAYPFGKDQPTEVWALARLRFFLKPRNRVWAQSGVKQLVTITVPKKAEVNLTNGLSQNEVKSRLQALADTIDSRGWTIKNIDSTYQSPLDSTSSDRLIGTTVATDSPDDVPNTDDMLDVTANPVAQKMDQMLISNANKRRQQLINNLDKLREAESIKKDGHSPSASVSTGRAFAFTASTDVKADEERLEKELEAKERTQHLALNNMRTLKPEPAKQAVVTTPAPTAKSTDQKDPDIINLARRNDLNVDVLGHEINKARGIDLDSSQDEVTISLH